MELKSSLVEKPPGLLLNPFPRSGGRTQQSNILRDELPFIPEKEEYQGKNAFLSPIDNDPEPREAEANFVEIGSDSTEGSESHEPMNVEERDVFLFRSPVTTPERDRSVLKSCKLEPFFSPMKTSKVKLDELSAGPPLLDLTRLMNQPLRPQTITPPRGEPENHCLEKTYSSPNGTENDSQTCTNLTRKGTVLPDALLNRVSDIVREKVSEGQIVNNSNWRSLLDSDVNQNMRTSAPGDPDTSQTSGSLDTDTKLSSDKSQTADQTDSGKPAEKSSQQGKKRKHDMATAEGGRKERKSRPNYFVAVQITNPQIKDHLAEVQEHIIQQQSLLSTAVVPPPTHHFTLHVSHLASDEDIKRAGKALDACREQLLSDWAGDPAPLLHVQGLGSFDGKVLFAKAAQDEGLEGLNKIAEIVNECLEREGIVSTDRRGFKPHLTILKLSKNPILFKKVRKIKPALYKSYSECEFGWQRIRGLQLCSMDEPKGSDGYYQVAHAIDFDLPAGEPADGSAGKSVKLTPTGTHPMVVKEELVKELQWDFHLPSQSNRRN